MRIVVLDCETTGLSGSDHIVELAALTVDAKSGRVLDEFDTLISPPDPLTVLNTSHIHGIYPDMLQDAPKFADIAAQVRELLNGSVLAAHNLPFDARFLRQEFDRLQLNADLGDGICTYRMTKKKLGVACQTHGIRMQSEHRALSDARAATELLQTLGVRGTFVPAQIESVGPRRQGWLRPRD